MSSTSGLPGSAAETGGAVDSITYDTVVSFLLSVVPEFRLGYEQEQARWGDEPIPPHVFLAEVANPLLSEALGELDDLKRLRGGQWRRSRGGAKQAGAREEGILRRAFDATEQLLTSSDRQLADFAISGIIEYFAFSRPEIVAQAGQFMGPASRACAAFMRAKHESIAAQKRLFEERAQAARMKRGRR